MNYDMTNIPAGYDRGRTLSPDVMEIWMRALAAHAHGIHIANILDLGCGTGRFSEALAQHFNATVVGMDPSEKMLQQARAKKPGQRVQYELGPAEAIALPSSGMDMIFMSMSFHHFVDRTLAARECRRVLRPGGIVFVRNGTRERTEAYPYVRFFPRTREMIHELLPSQSELRETFETAGLRLKAAEVIDQTIAANWNIYAEKLEAGGDSVLSRLSPEELESGVTALRRYAATHADESISEPIDLFVFH
jgi:ubiquinone/menaquinone biosynthesis C-methylase UbiE